MKNTILQGMTSSHLLKQLAQLKKWALNLAAVYLSFLLFVDYLKASPTEYNEILVIRIGLMLVPFTIVLLFFHLGNRFNLNRHLYETIAAIAVILVGIGHIQILMLTEQLNQLTSVIGVSIILLYAGLLLALPTRLATISSLAIVLITCITYLYAGADVTQVATLFVFYSLFIGCCLFINKTCISILESNLTLIRKSSQQAHTDELTQLYNRRYFYHHSETTNMQAYRENKFMGLLLINLDNFKAVNDNLGYKYGDWVLQEFAATLQNHSMHPLDFVTRWGGDEFVMLVYDGDEEYVINTCQKIIQDVDDIAEKIKEINSHIHLSVSIGIAFNEKDESYPVKLLMEMADRTLYKIKQRGKNSFALCDKAKFTETNASSHFLNTI